MTDTKTCTRCDRDRPPADFDARTDCDGLQSWCRDCHRAYQRGRDRGRANIKVPKSLHATIKEAAQANGMAMNRFLVQVISGAVEQQCVRRGCVRPALRERHLCRRCKREMELAVEARKA